MKKIFKVQMMKKCTLALLAATVLSGSLVAMQPVELTPEAIRSHFANPVTMGANRPFYDLDAVKAALDRGAAGIGASHENLYSQAIDIVKAGLVPTVGANGLNYYDVNYIALAKDLSSSRTDFQALLAEATRDALAHPSIGADGRNYYQTELIVLALDRGAVGVGAAHPDLYAQGRTILLNELTNPGTGANGPYFASEYMEMAKTQLADAEINGAFMDATLEILSSPINGPVPYDPAFLDYIRNNKVIYRQDVLDKVATIN